MLFLLFVGFIFGVLTVLLLQFVYIFRPFTFIGGGRDGDDKEEQETFPDQFLPFRIPIELKQILISPNRDEELKKKESCISLNLLLQFLYQEFRDTKAFRRWMLKKLQMEFNELLSRSASGKLLKDIKLRSLTPGVQFPVIKRIHAENVKLSNDSNNFELLDLILDIEYRGGFELSVDVVALLGQQASLTVNVPKLSGELRVQLTRHPYSHWSFSFVQEPVIDFKVDSKFQGRPLPQLVPLIINQFRRTIRKRHVLPAYKMRFRPFFHNPLLQPSADPNDFGHISMSGCLKLTVMGCSRLNLSVVPATHSELICTLMTATKPQIFGQQSTNFACIAIKFIRYSAVEPIGLSVGREFIIEKGSKQVAVISVEKNSVADRAGFKIGDLILAINNICILTDRQASKILSNTLGELAVLVERELSKIDSEDEVMDQLSSSAVVFDSNGHPIQDGDKNIKTELFNDGFIHVSFDSPSKSDGSAPGLDEGDIKKVHSFVDLTKHGTAPRLPPSVNVESFSDNREEEHLTIDRTNSIRKARSASNLFTNSNEHSDLMIAESPLSMKSSCLEEAELRRISKPTDFDAVSLSSESSHGSRKHRIAERAAQVAQKFNTGKATVKEMIGKRIHKRPEDAAGSYSPVIQKRNTESSIIGGEKFLTVSKSEEAQLSMRLMTTTAASSGVVLRERINVTRTRSHSEPDTTILAVKKKSDERSRENSSSESETGRGETGGFSKNINEEKNKTFKETEEKSPVFENVGARKSSESKKIAKSFEKSTKNVDVVENPDWNETVNVWLDGRMKYLNVLLYSQPKPNLLKKSTVDAPFLLGYVNILIPEVLDDCSTTKSLYHQQTFTLRPFSSFPKVSPQHHNLTKHVGFDARLCYGDVTLGFEWMPAAVDEDQCDSHLPNVLRTIAGQENAAGDSSNQPLFMDGHKWISTHFQQATVCNVCQKKIWFKTAFKCGECSMISHKKCLTRGGLLGRCGQVHETTAKDRLATARDSWNTDEIVEAVEAVTEALDSSATTTPEHSAHVGSGRKLQRVFAEKFAGLRRRKGKVSSDSTTSPILMPTMEDVTGSQWVTQDSPFHSMLYTKGGTYNEHMIYAAKDLGKDLFVDLPLVERKTKINEQIDKLQVEIDAAIAQRLEVITKKKALGENSPVKHQFDKEIIKFDDRLQALAILMLHYCAGLQHCMDLEESNSVTNVVGELEKCSVSDSESPALSDNDICGKETALSFEKVDKENNVKVDEGS